MAAGQGGDDHVRRVGRLGEAVGDIGERRNGAGAGKAFVVEFGGNADRHRLIDRGGGRAAIDRDGKADASSAGGGDSGGCPLVGRDAAGGKRERPGERRFRREGGVEGGVVGDVMRQAGGRPGAAFDLCDCGDAVAGEDGVAVAGIECTGRDDLLDGDQHLAGGGDHRPVEGAGADDGDVAHGVGARRVEDDGIEAKRRDDADFLAAGRVADGGGAGDAGHHVGAGRQLERHQRQVLLGGAQRLDHRQRRPVIDRDVAGFGNRAEARRQAEDIEAGETDIDAGDRLRLQQNLERQAAGP